LYKISVFSEIDKSPVKLTKDGEALRAYDGFFEGRSSMLAQGDTQCEEIRLDELWDLSKPRDYTVSMEHVQRDAANIKSFFTVRAPDFKFTVLAK
jgi:hypothetical protein